MIARDYAVLKRVASLGPEGGIGRGVDKTHLTRLHSRGLIVLRERPAGLHATVTGEGLDALAKLRLRGQS